MDRTEEERIRAEGSRRRKADQAEEKEGSRRRKGRFRKKGRQGHAEERRAGSTSRRVGEWAGGSQFWAYGTLSR